MSDTPTQIDSLRRSVRLWKTLALTLLVGLGLVIVVGMTAAAVQVERARQQAEAARDAELEAHRAIEQFLQKDLLDQGQADRRAGK